MIDYYDIIMGSDKCCFIPTFNRLWKKEISSHGLPYAEALQITTGNRLRPIMMAWGYYANCLFENNEYIADYSIPIELIHKSSILLDDLIDDDIARHEVDTFHIQYSCSEALLYAIYIINRGIGLMLDKDIIHNSDDINILLNVINNMAKGGIKEVSSDRKPLSVSEVKEIIDLETTPLIKNSFVLGYKLSSKIPQEIPNDITNIGSLCGYCFQILNDMEPFCAPAKNKKYKGVINYDFEKQRKNIVVAWLYGTCKTSERKVLLGATDNDAIFYFLNKYGVLQTLTTKVESIIGEIMHSITNLSRTNAVFYCDFSKFLHNMFEYCFKKCNLSIKHDLFNN